MAPILGQAAPAHPRSGSKEDPLSCQYPTMSQRSLGRPIRTLVYADSQGYSGAESFFCEVVRDLAADGQFDLVLAAPPANRELSANLEAAARRKIDYPVPAQPPFLAGLMLPLSAQRAGRALEGVEADVALINLPSAEYGSSPLLSRELSDLPSVGLLHIDHSLRDVGFRLGRLRGIGAGVALRRLDHVAVLSEEAEGRAREAWALKATAISRVRMPKPSLARVPQTQARRELGLELTSRLIGIAGRLSFKQKGQDTFVDAASILIDRVPDIRFVVAGEGPDRDRLVRMVSQAGLGERFQLLGQVDDIGSFLSAIDVIAIPSRFEGLPLIALEALQVGVPGVASGVDGLCDVWPPEWTIPASEPDLLARSLEAILHEDSSRVAELIKEGRVLARERETRHPGEDVAALLSRVVRGSAEC